MSTKKSALESLAVKLDAAATSLGLEPILELANVNPNWDPAKHPHGKHGHWAKKGEATYHALSDLANLASHKKAQYVGKAGLTAGGGLIGGVTISPPPDEPGSPLSIDYILQKGETAYKVQQPHSDHVVITHADNSATELNATAVDQTPKIGKQYKPGEFQSKFLKNPAVTTETLDTVPGESYSQKVKSAKIGTLIVSKGALGPLPVGTVVRKRNAKYTHVWEDWQKLDDGSWKRTAAFKQNTKIGTIDNDFGKQIESGKSTFIVHEAPQKPITTAEKQAIVDKVKETTKPIVVAPAEEPTKEPEIDWKHPQPGMKPNGDQLDELPVGTTIKVWKTLPDKTWVATKNGNQDWIDTDNGATRNVISYNLAMKGQAEVVSAPGKAEPKVEPWVPKVGLEITAQVELNQLLPGTLLHNVNNLNGAGADYLLGQDGTWKRYDMSAGSITTKLAADMAKIVTSENTTVTIKELPAQKIEPAPETGLPLINSIGDLNSLPDGTVIKTGYSNDKAAHELIKKNGGWYSTNPKYAALGTYNAAAGGAVIDSKIGAVVESIPGTIPKSLEELAPKAFEPVKDESVKVPGTDITLGPGESLWGSKAVTHKYAVVKDGKVVKLLNQDTGEDLAESMAEGNYKSALWNWNKSLATGKLLHVAGAAGSAPETSAYSVGQHITKEDLNKLPVGTKIDYYLFPGGHHAEAWTRVKLPNGKWVKPDSSVGGGLNWETGHWQIAELPEAPAPKAPEKPTFTIGQSVDKELQAKLPVGAGIGMADKMSVWKKQTGGAWKAGSGITATPDKLNWNQPWVIKELPAAAPAPKASAPKAKASAAALTSDNPSFTLPNGTVITPGPGEHVLKPTSQYEGNVSVWLLKDGGKVEAYEPSGTKYHSALQKHYAPGGKKSVKSLTAAGATLVASGPAKQQGNMPTGSPTVEFATVESLKYFSAYFSYHAQEHISKRIDAALEKFRTTGASLYTGTTDPGFAQEMANLAASLQAGRDKYKDQLTPADKTRITRALKFANTWVRLSDLSQKVHDPAHTIDVQDQAEMSALKETVSAAVPYGFERISPAVNWLTKEFKQAEFSQSVKGLGFDPFQATHEQTQQYVTGKGAFNAAGMSPEDAKQWMMLDLNAPNVMGNKAAIEKSAGLKLQLAAVAANAQAVLAKKQAAQPSKAEVAKQKAIDAKIAAVYTDVAKMSDLYSGPTIDGKANALAYDWPTGSWFHNGKIISSTDAAELVKQPGWTANGKKIGSPEQIIAKGLEEQYGAGWKSAYSQMFTNVGNMSVASLSDRKTYLRAQLTGDQIGMYNIMAGQPGFSSISWIDHPGSPNSDQGKAARQALSNYLAAQSWWHPDKTAAGWPVKDVDAANEALGLNATNKLINSWDPETATWNSKQILLQKWLNWHTSLPEPQTSKINNEPVALYGPSGVKVMVPPGSLVANSDNSMVVFAPDKILVSALADTKIHEYDYPFGSWKDPQTGHAFQLQLPDYTDATPTWGASSTPTGLTSNKPADVDQVAWEAATGAEAGGKALKDLIGEYATTDDAAIAQHIASISVSGVGMVSKDRLLLAQAPDPVQRMAVWCSQVAYEQPFARQVFKAILAKARSGEYITSETQTWALPNGVKIVIPPGAALHDASAHGYGYTLVTSPQSAFLLNTNGEYATQLQGSNVTAYSSGPKITESFANLTPEKASLEGFEFTHAAWDALGEAEDKSWTGKGPEAGAAFAFKQALENVPSTALSEQYSAITPKIHSLPSGVKALLVKVASDKNTDTLNAVVWKIGKGFYDAQPTQPEKPIFDPGKSYSKPIADGKTDYAGLNNYWPYSVKKAFVADFIPAWNGTDEEIVDKIAELQANHDGTKVEKDSTTDPSKHLVLTYVKQGGGSHGAELHADQYGELWLTKNYPKDPFNDLLVEVEHSSNVVGKMFGFSTPQTFTHVQNGVRTYVQHWDDATGTLQGAGPEDLNDAQLANVMQAQVLNWLIANHDGYGANFLKHPDGKSIISIDLGQAYKHLHDDKLEPGYLPPENFDKQWFDRFFKDVQSGKIDRERAEVVARRVMFKAYQVQSQNDKAFEKIISSALDHRPASSYPKKYPNKEAFLAAAMERKHGILGDFEKLYKDVWSKAGWDWQIDTEDFGKKVGAAHVSNGMPFTEDLSKAKAAGLALMVDAPALEESHIMLTPMKAKDGSTTVIGYAKVADDKADKTLTSWCKEHVEGPLVSQSEPVAVYQPGAELFHLNEMYSNILAYAKTVGMHAQNGGKEPDGKYNEATIQSCNTVVASMKDLLDTVLEHRKKDPTTPFSGKGSKFEYPAKFSTLEQQDAWVNAVQQKMDEYDLTKLAHAANEPVHVKYPTAIPFKVPNYEPSKDLGEPGKIIEKYKADDGTTWVKTADGGHYAEGGSKKVWASAQEYANVASDPKSEKIMVDTQAKQAKEVWSHPSGVKWVRLEEKPHLWQLYDTDGKKVGEAVSTVKMNDALATDPDAWVYDKDGAIQEKSAEVEVDGKTFKVTHHKAALHPGMVDFKTGDLIETKTSGTTEFQKGAEYLIEYDNIKIRYRPWNEPGVTKTQQGTLTFEISKWNPNSPSEVDDVLDTLRHVGINVDPATEQSLELHYWRHLADQVNNPYNATKNPANIAKLQGELNKRLKPSMTQAEQLQAYRDAWTACLGKEHVAKASWQPKFGTWFGQKDAGRPMWERPDFSLQDLKKAYGNGTYTPTHAIFINEAKESEYVNAGIVDYTKDGLSKTDQLEVWRAAQVIQSGGLLPSEERVRVLGELKGGMSSSSDQNKGSSSFVFTRQNVGPLNYGGSVAFLLNPLDALRAENYALSSDGFGNRSHPAYQGTFNTSIFKNSDSSNELLIKNGTAVEYVVVSSEAHRKALLARLKELGIEQIAGKPAKEMILIGETAWRAKMKEIWARVLTEYAAAESEVAA